MRQSTCPVCNSIPYKNLKAFQICTCKQCQVGWTFIPDSIDTEELYQDEVYQVVDNRRSIFDRIIFSEARKILSKAKQIRSDASTLLDFGSGKGQFLWVAKVEGWNGLRIETVKARADFATIHYQVKVSLDFYSGREIEGAPFELITLNHVLEHLPEPMALVNELLISNLVKGGLVYTEVPRANSWQVKITGKNWTHWDILIAKMANIDFQKG